MHRLRLTTLAALCLVGAAFASVPACAGPTRPDPNAPGSTWAAYCESLTGQGCSACASDERCGWCPTSRLCFLYDQDNQGAAASCPDIYPNAERCTP